jgi:hypothetical protein
MDVFSCRDFDPSQVEQHLAAKLGAYDLQITDLSFSLDYEPSAPPRQVKRSPRSGRDALRGWSKSPS